MKETMLDVGCCLHFLLCVHLRTMGCRSTFSASFFFFFFFFFGYASRLSIMKLKKEEAPIELEPLEYSIGNSTLDTSHA
jgi:hypothetical protein